MEEKGNMLNGNGEEGATADPLIREIQSLKKQTGAVILAHYYVDGAIREIADHVGDSYYLAKLDTQIPQQTIVLCGVTFMGESVKLLNGEKTVLMPDLTAGCPMADLYAIGETSCNGVHVANRLSSNSLLECLVFARRAASDIAQGLRAGRSKERHRCSLSADPVSADERHDQADQLLEKYHQLVLEKIREGIHDVPFFG